MVEIESSCTFDEMVEENEEKTYKMKTLWNKETHTIYIHDSF